MIDLLPYKIDILKIHSEYNDVFTTISNINQNIEKLQKDAKASEELLVTIREKEHTLIDNIEKKVGRKLTADDFAKILKADGSNS